MTYAVQINDADYGDQRVRIEAKSYYDRQTNAYDWAVPVWEEMGLAELEGVFDTREEAEKALASISDEMLREYGFHKVAIPPVDFTGLDTALDELRKPVDEVRE